MNRDLFALLALAVSVTLAAPVRRAVPGLGRR